MTELEIYDSQGERFDTDQPAVSTRIETFFFGGVRLHVETDPQVELTVFFRARESKASRADQYYAVYRTDSQQRLFDRFITALREKMEDEHGMLLQTTSEDVQVYAELAGEHTAPGTPSEHDRISSLLSEGRKLRFGVPGPTDALGLLQKYLGGAPRSIAIAEDSSNEELETCDLVIELGSKERLEPLGETETMLARKKRRSGAGSSRPRMTTNTSAELSRVDKLKGKAKAIGMPLVVAVGTFVVLLAVVVAVGTVTDLVPFGIDSLLELLPS